MPNHRRQAQEQNHKGDGSEEDRSGECSDHDRDQGLEAEGGVEEAGGGGREAARTLLRGEEADADLAEASGERVC